MTEPITSNRSLIVPNTGDLSGAWGTSALNPNFQSIDTLFGGVTTISLSSTTTILLSVPATTGVWPGGNPSQSMNSMIKFTGAQTGSAVIQFTLPGFYIVNNQCTGTTSVQLAPSAGVGNKIGAPPGQKIHIFYDGTDMDYVDMPTPGAALDLHTNTTTLPPWMTACTVSPYLVKDGSVYTSSVYPALSQLLGSTYGGNGVTTFGVPDERSRSRLGVDTVQAASGATSARLTFAQAGFTGSLLGASGGTSATVLLTANLPPYTPTGSLILGQSPNPNNIPSVSGSIGFVQVASAPGTLVPGSAGAWGSSGTLTLTCNAQGGTSQSMVNVPPAIVSILPLIKT